MCNGSQAGQQFNPQQGYGMRQMAPSTNYGILGEPGMPSTGTVNYGPTSPYGEAALPPSGPINYGPAPIRGEPLGGMDSRVPGDNVRYAPTAPFGEAAMPSTGTVRYGAPPTPFETTPQSGGPPQLDANGQPLSLSPEDILRWQQFRSMPRGF